MVGNSNEVPVGFDRTRDATALGLGGLFAALVAVSLWASVVAGAFQALSGWLGGVPVPIVAASAVTSLLGVGLGAVTFARYRGLDLGVALPREGRATGLGVVLAPAALVVATAAVGNAAFGVTLGEVTNRWISAEASPGSLLRVVVAPAAFAGLGYGLLFCGVVYEYVRDLVGADDAVAVATALVGFFWLLPVDAVARLGLSVGGVYELVVSLAFGVAFGMGLGTLYRHAGGGAGDGLERRHLAVLAVALLGVVGVATDLTTLPAVVDAGLWVVAFGLALLGYERTRSVWVPALSLAVLDLALGAVVYAESLLGLAAV